MIKTHHIIQPLIFEVVGPLRFFILKNQSETLPPTTMNTHTIVAINTRQQGIQPQSIRSSSLLPLMKIFLKQESNNVGCSAAFFSMPRFYFPFMVRLNENSLICDAFQRGAISIFGSNFHFRASLFGSFFLTYSLVVSYLCSDYRRSFTDNKFISRSEVTNQFKITKKSVRKRGKNIKTKENTHQQGLQDALFLQRNSFQSKIVQTYIFLAFV